MIAGHYYYLCVRAASCNQDLFFCGEVCSNFALHHCPLLFSLELILNLKLLRHEV